MWKLFGGPAVLIALAVAPANPAAAQVPIGPYAGRCGNCMQPPRCGWCNSAVPVVETCYRPRQVYTWRNVCRTAYRCQPRVETVPVVTYVRRLTYQSVPYTAVDRVPQLSTVWTPERRLRMVPVQYNLSPPPATQPANPAPSSGGNTSSIPRPRANPVLPGNDFANRAGGSGYIGSPIIPVSQRLQSNPPPAPSVRAPSAAIVWQTRGADPRR